MLTWRAEVVAPITPELAGKRPSADSTPSTSLMGAPPLIEASGDLDGDSHWHGDPSYMGPSPSMLHAVERGAVMHIREQTAERLVTTLQVRPRPPPTAPPLSLLAARRACRIDAGIQPACHAEQRQPYPRVRP